MTVVRVRKMFGPPVGVTVSIWIQEKLNKPDDLKVWVTSRPSSVVEIDDRDRDQGVTHHYVCRGCHPAREDYRIVISREKLEWWVRSTVKSTLSPRLAEAWVIPLMAVAVSLSRVE